MPYLALTINGRSARFHGGPYRQRPPGLPGINMAAELQHLDALIRIPTQDFSTPDPKLMMRGMIQAYDQMRHGDLYVGCMGGIGRTGLFLALMVRWMFECEEFQLRIPWDEDARLDLDPVRIVRDYYDSRAVETPEQEAYVRDFPIHRLVLLTPFI